jgi:hypothetical protein
LTIHLDALMDGRAKDDKNSIHQLKILLLHHGIIMQYYVFLIIISAKDFANV